MEFIFKQKGEKLSCFGYNQSKNWLYFNWQGSIDLPSIKIIVKMAALLQEEYQCPFLINDNSNLETNFQDLNCWVEENWLPHATAHGLKYFAHIVSPNFFVRISALDLHSRFNGKIEHRIFTDCESAENWLKSCQAELKHKVS